jgi:adenosine kinase
MKILVTGSIAYDRIMNFHGRFGEQILPNNIHQLNVSFFIHRLEESFGGIAGNIAYNLRMLGAAPTLYGAIGAKDAAPYQQWWKKNKIDTSLVRVLPNQQTGSAYMMTDIDDNQISGFFPGAMLQPFTKTHRLSARQLKSFDCAIVSAQNPVDMLALPKIFRAAKLPYVFDPGQQISSLSGVQLRQAIVGSWMVIGNDYEMTLLMKKTGWSLATLQSRVPYVVVTKGKIGSTIYYQNKATKISSAKPKKVVDPTGAGDAYRTGLLFGLLSDWPVKQAGQLGSVVAAYAVEQQGTQSHSFTAEQLRRRYEQNFGTHL